MGTAPGPERAVPDGRYSPDSAIQVVIDKYLDHIPLARQHAQAEREPLSRGVVPVCAVGPKASTS